MKKLIVVLVVMAVFALQPAAQAYRGGPGLAVPCLFGLGALFGLAAASHPPVVVAPTQCFELVPVWGNPRWDGSAYIREKIGERRVPVPCPPQQ